MQPWQHYYEEALSILAMDDNDADEQFRRIREILKELNEFSLSNEPPTKEEVSELLKSRRLLDGYEQITDIKPNLIPVLFMKIMLTRSKRPITTKLMPEWTTFANFWAPLLPVS